jgi:hypothetical protein
MTDEGKQTSAQLGVTEGEVLVQGVEYPRRPHI